MPLETAITRDIRKKIKLEGWGSIKNFGGPYSEAGIPDLTCGKNGICVMLEVKQPGNKPSPIQVRKMQDIERDFGFPCFVVRSAEEALGFLRSVEQRMGSDADDTVAALPAENLLRRDARKRRRANDPA